MYVKIKTMRIIVACVLIFSVPIHAVNWEKLGTGLFAVGGALVAAGAAAVGFSWLTQPADGEFIEIVQKHARAVIESNAQYMTLFKKELSWEHYGTHVYKRVMETVSEEFLYSLSSQMYDTHGYTMPKNIAADCNVLEHDKEELDKRISKLERERFLTPEQQYHLNEMRTLFISVRELYEELALLRDYIEKHRVYFELAEQGWEANKAYEEDVRIYQAYAYDAVTLLYHLDIHVARKYKHERFIYIKYVESLENTIYTLKHLKNRVIYQYSGMLNWTVGFITHLCQLRQAVEGRYQLQLLERERVHIELRRKELEAKRLVLEHEAWEREKRQVDQLLSDIAYKMSVINHDPRALELNFTLNL